MDSFKAVLIMSCCYNTIRPDNKPTLTIFGHLKKKSKYKVVISSGFLSISLMSAFHVLVMNQFNVVGCLLIVIPASRRNCFVVFCFLGFSTKNC